LVGCPNDVTKPDIQLQGLGIQPEHCVVDITENEVFVTPVEGARYMTFILIFMLHETSP
jgi:kinesin family protein 13